MTPRTWAIGRAAIAALVALLLASAVIASTGPAAVHATPVHWKTSEIAL